MPLDPSKHSCHVLLGCRKGSCEQYGLQPIGHYDSFAAYSSAQLNFWFEHPDAVVTVYKRDSWALLKPFFAKHYDLALNEAFYMPCKHFEHDFENLYRLEQLPRILDEIQSLLSLLQENPYHAELKSFFAEVDIRSLFRLEDIKEEMKVIQQHAKDTDACRYDQSFNRLVRDKALLEKFYADFLTAVRHMLATYKGDYHFIVSGC